MNVLIAAEKAGISITDAQAVDLSKRMAITDPEPEESAPRVLHSGNMVLVSDAGEPAWRVIKSGAKNAFYFRKLADAADFIGSVADESMLAYRVQEVA